MSTNQERVHELFNTARHLAVQDREAFLDKECGDDAVLREEVESLLKYTPTFAPTVKKGTIDVGEKEVVDHRYETGDRIGKYEIIRELGEGGFGIVYFAKQHEPVEREVAIKVLHSKRCTDTFIQGFEAEHQTLANMNHPGIAHFYDAGLTQHNQPFFVMEFVSGQPITDYCDEHRLTIKQRLSLFADVCKAVQHAHNKGIIHRDLTPNNILVSKGDYVAYNKDAPPRIQIIDFGIARKIDEATADVMGTLVYMSPEQATPDASVDTRSDIYTLGVVLYELLVGKLPLDAEMFKGVALQAQLKVVKEQDPPTPSTKLSGIQDSEEAATIASKRQEKLDALLRMLRCELDWIPRRALQKDPRNRYRTANEFGEDIFRYLNDEVLVAVPDSAGYRFKKLAKRHKVAFVSVATVVIVLLIGIIGTASGWISAYAEKNRAVQAEAETEIEKNRVLLERDNATRTNEELEKLANILIDMQIQLSSSPTQDTLREILKNTNSHLRQISGLSEVLKAKVHLLTAYEFIVLRKFSEAKQLLLDAKAELEKNHGAKNTIVMISKLLIEISHIEKLENQPDGVMSYGIRFKDNLEIFITNISNGLIKTLEVLGEPEEAQKYQDMSPESEPAEEEVAIDVEE